MTQDRRNHVDVFQVAFGGMGGTTSVVRSLTEGLRQRGITSVVLRYADKADLDAADRTWLGVPQVAPCVRLGRIDWRAIRRCISEVRRLRPRAVIAHNPKLVPALAMGFLLSGRRPSVVVVEHQAMALRTWGLNVTSLVAAVAAQIVILLTPLAEARYPWRRFPLSSIRRRCIVPNGVDVVAFSPGATGSRRSGRLVTATRLVPQKNVGVLVNLVHTLITSRHRKVEIRIAGDGPCREALEIQADSRLGQPITFVGVLDEVNLAGFLREATAYVQASDGETLSTSMLQAMACEVPLVATAVPGVEDVVPAQLAWLVPPGDEDALANAVLDVLENPQRAAEVASAARAYVVSNYSIDAMTTGYLTALRAIGVDFGDADHSPEGEDAG